MNRTTDKVEETSMTDTQAKRTDLLARLDELDRMAENTNDPASLKYIRERKKAIRLILDEHT